MTRSSSKILDIDVLIFGGGIAGLWLLNQLQQQDYRVVLLESHALGSAQTMAAQGIIHSGVKYALTGKLSKSAQAIKAMPERWCACLTGQGELDLSAVKVLAEHQLMWSPGSMRADLVNFFASKSLASRVRALAPSELPSILSQNMNQGKVYALSEPVLDVPSLIEQLALPCQSIILPYDLASSQLDSTGIQLNQYGLRLNAKRLVLLAGAGNSLLLEQLGLANAIPMQLRPLHMSYVKAPLGELPMLYAHSMQASTKPRVTITSHQTDQHSVWYLGGDLAESGIKRTTEQQNTFVRQELSSLLPNHPWPWMHSASNPAWEIDSFMIDRAEARQRFGRRPEGPVLRQRGSVLAGWPTKLAFAPVMASLIQAELPGPAAKSSATTVCSADELAQVLQALPSTNIAKPYWQR